MSRDYEFAICSYWTEFAYAHIPLLSERGAIFCENVSIRFRRDPFGPDFFSDLLEFFLVEFVKLQGGCFTVEGIYHHFAGADVHHTLQPLREIGILAVVEGYALLFTAEEHGLDDEIAVKGFEMFDNLLDINGHNGCVDRIEHLLGAGIKLQQRVLDALEGGTNLGACQLRGIGEAGDHGIGIVLVAQGNESIDDFVEMRMKGGLPVAGEGDAVNGNIVVPASYKFVFNSLQHFLHRVVFTGGQAFLQSPSALAVEAVEGTDLDIDWQKVDAEGMSQSAAVDGSKGNGLPKKGGHVLWFY